MLILDPKPPLRSRRPGQDAAGHVEGRRHVARIERLAAERLAGLARLDPGAARHRAGIERLAADHPTGIGPGAAAIHVEWHVAGTKRLAVAPRRACRA
jgi:hypothetical protein